MSAAHCTRCGASNRPEARFCTQCRHPLSPASAKPVCSRGHRLDPTWTECPFCKTSQEPDAHRFPIMEETGSGVDARGARLPPLPPQERTAPTTRVEAPKTRKQPGPLLGVVFTYSADRNGAAFPVRMGRNLIGSIDRAEIRASDASVAPEHALLLAKPGRFALQPLEAGRWTFLDRQLVRGQTAIESGAVIQTGKVLWRFLAFVPPDPAQGVPLPDSGEFS